MKEETKSHHHRSSLKQKNKPFKGGSSGRSKSRGRSAVQKKTTQVKHDLSKVDRKNKMTLIQQHKRQEMNQQRRMYSGKDGMSRVIVLVPVSSAVQLDKLALLNDSTVYSERSKQNLYFIHCDRNGKSQEQWAKMIIDFSQIADCICPVASALDEDLDGYGRDALAIIRSIGISSSAGLVQGLSNHKNAQDVKPRWFDIIQAQLFGLSRLFCADSLNNNESREMVEIERILGQQTLKGMSWRDLRPYMVTESISIEPVPQGDTCIVKATGFIRGGKAFSANRLVHLSELSETFTLAKIEAVPTSTLSFEKTAAKEAHAMQVDEPLCQYKDVTICETLESENSGDPFSSEALKRVAEQMMMDKDEDEDEDENAPSTDGKRTIMVPKGTSAYQAAWLEGEEPMPDVDYEEIAVEEGNDEHGAPEFHMDMDEHNAKLQEHKELQGNNGHFPDEIELDPHTSARTRLQKYRGVQSLRTSTWNPTENLPFDYSKIFRFENYQRSRKVAIEENDSPFTVGQKVVLWIEGVPTEAAMRLSTTTSIFGLLKHEQRQTVVNFSFTQSKSFEDGLVNKQELVAVIGPRKFIINPILSEHSNASLHKMYRNIDATMQSTMVIGTIFAPVTFTPSPVLLFMRKKDTEELTLVGSGSIMDLNPNRIVLKRITLTGTPYKVHQRSVVVRFMFSSPADINWFKPVELVTRTQARGHIRDSLGTHGYMKCLFDRIVFQHDIVAMHLYKRAFPKWTTRPYRL